MTFVSDAQRRWWFANHGPAAGGAGSGGSDGGAGGSGGAGGGGGTAESSVNTNTAPRDVDAGYAAYMASPERREERLQYAQAMYPDLSEADALRKLNDRNG